MKVSRLEVSFVLEMNHGPYSCISENKAGVASTNFTLNILPGNGDDSFPSDHSSSDSDSPNAEASQNSHTKSDKEKNSDHSSESSNKENQFKSNKDNNSNGINLKSIGTESMVFGLIIGILVGIVLVLVTLSAAIVVMCRKKSNQRSRISSSSSSFNTHHTKSDQSTLDRMAHLGLATESELEKLTPSSLSTSSHVLMMGMIPNGKSEQCSEHESGYGLLPSRHNQDPNAMNSEMMFDTYEGSIYGRLHSSNGTNLSGSVINPVQKPPRIGFGDQIDVPAGMRQPSSFCLPRLLFTFTLRIIGSSCKVKAALLVDRELDKLEREIEQTNKLMRGAMGKERGRK